MNSLEVPPQRLNITDPRDGSLVGTLTAADSAEIAGAVDSACGARRGWGLTPATERGAALQRAAALLEEHKEELARLNERETGRPRAEALAGVEAGVATLRQYAELGPLHRGHSLCGGPGAIDYSKFEPRGLAIVITPWNDPVAIASGLLGAALACGNVVIHKPSERCPHLGRLLGEVLAPAFPEWVLTTVIGGADSGVALVEDPRVDVVAHVGSTAAGLDIAARAARTGAHVIRENGGKDALIVDADVAPDWAAGQASVGAFANSGQICTSVERIFVHHHVAERFVEALTEQARARNASGEVAPLVDRRLREEVHRHVSEAVLQGAVVTEGGRVPRGPGSHYPATVLTECSPSMLLLREETFGPVAPVVTVDDFAEGVRLASAGSYGLASTVLTRSMTHAQHAITSLRVGTVKINAVFGGAPGGSAHPRGSSGAGIGYGPELMQEFTQLKVVHLDVTGGLA